mgnify:CR=1 FL=1
MAEEKIQVTEADLSAILTQKVNQITNLEIHVATLSRVLRERGDLIVELQAHNNGKEPVDANSG